MLHTISDAWLWRGLNRNGDELGRVMLCLRICQDDDALDHLNELLNDTLEERGRLNSELWRRRERVA